MSQARDPLLPVYAIYGEDRPKVERTAARLVRRVQEEGGAEPERLTALETPAAQVADGCQALSFGGVRLVIVEDADAWRAGDVDPLVDYLADPNPQTVLALVSAGGVAQKLHQAVERAGRALRWGPDPKASVRERRKWLEGHFAAEVARAGGSVTTTVARLVVERVCTEPTDAARTALNAMMLTSEAEKLAALSAGRPIDRDMVVSLVPSNPEARVYELADALVSGSARQTYDRLNDLAGGDDRSAPQVILMGLMRHYRALAAAQSLGPGASADAVADATGLRGFPAKKAAEQARALPAGAGERGLVRLARLELDLRVSSVADLGTSPDDGRRFAIERAARDLLAIARGGAPD